MVASLGWNYGPVVQLGILRVEAKERLVCRRKPRNQKVAGSNLARSTKICQVQILTGTQQRALSK